MTIILYFQIPKVDDPNQLMENITEWLEQYKKKNKKD